MIETRTQTKAQKILAIVDFIECVPDLVAIDYLKNKELTSDQINHIIWVCGDYKISIKVWKLILLGQYDWSDRIKHLRSKENIKCYELMANEWQALWNLVHSTFCYLPQQDPLNLVLDSSVASNWNEEYLFREILIRKIQNHIIECCYPYFEVGRKQASKELKSILDSGIFNPIEKRKQGNSSKDLVQVNNGKKLDNPYLELVVAVAYKNPKLSKCWDSYLNANREKIEMAEKRNKRTRSTKTESMVGSYAWCKGKKKLGTKKGGGYQ